VHKLFAGLIRRTACACAQFSGCSSTTNVHSETGQMAVCCQNLPLGALSSRSAPSVLVGELFKKFGFFNTGVGLLPYHFFSRCRVYIKRKKENSGTLLRLVVCSVGSVTDDMTFPYRLLLRPLSSVM
jgi:hypothetical protein